jgi:hypothetical protein
LEIDNCPFDEVYAYWWKMKNYNKLLPQSHVVTIVIPIEVTIHNIGRMGGLS